MDLGLRPPLRPGRRRLRHLQTHHQAERPPSGRARRQGATIMSNSSSQTGMVDQLDLSDAGPTPAEIAFAHAYLAAGTMDPAITARLSDPARIAERTALTAQRRARDWGQVGYYRAANAALAGQPVPRWRRDNSRPGPSRARGVAPSMLCARRCGPGRSGAP